MWSCPICTLIIREQLVASPMLRMLSRGKSMNMPLPLTGLLREPIADAISIVPNLTGYFRTGCPMITMTFTVMARYNVFSPQGIHRAINLFLSAYRVVQILR